jgi:predicted TIM-barrel fold metal-dependent hydrolase
MVHSGTPPHTEPLQIATLADIFPDATIILAHAGLSETYAADARAAAKRHDNVYLETSCLPAGYTGMAIRELGADKVMFGSDSPWNVTETELGKIKVLELSDEENRKVLGGTAARIFGIDRSR